MCYLFVFLFDADTAFELYLDAAVADDDLFDQLFEDGTIICVHDAAVFDMLFEGVQVFQWLLYWFLPSLPSSGPT